MSKKDNAQFIPPERARVFWAIQRVLLAVGLWICLKEVVLPTPDRPEGLLGFFWNPSFLGTADGLPGLYPVLLTCLVFAFATGWWPGVTAAGLASLIIVRILTDIPTPWAGMLAGALVAQAATALIRSLRSMRHERLWAHSQRQLYASNLAAATALGGLVGIPFTSYSGDPIPAILAGCAVVTGIAGRYLPIREPGLPKLKLPGPIKEVAARASTLLSFIPIKVCLLLVVAAAVVGEHFPLSPFPMYSQWKPDTYLIYFTDKDDNPIPIQTLTYLKAGRYKGMFDAQLKKIKAENRKHGRKPDLVADFGYNEFNKAGLYILEWIEKNVHPDLVAKLEPLRPLKVVRREIVIVDGKLSHEDQKVASGDELEPGSER